LDHNIARRGAWDHESFLLTQLETHGVTPPHMQSRCGRVQRVRWHRHRPHSTPYPSAYGGVTTRRRHGGCRAVAGEAGHMVNTGGLDCFSQALPWPYRLNASATIAASGPCVLRLCLSPRDVLSTPCQNRPIYSGHKDLRGHQEIPSALSSCRVYARGESAAPCRRAYGLRGFHVQPTASWDDTR
jgi:hypothetical protein